MSKTWNPAAERDQWTGVPHVRIRIDIIESAAWNSLSFSAQAFYTAMRAMLRQGNNGDIACTPATMSGARRWSRTTIYQALAELESAGLIAKTRQGGIGVASKTCSLFRFTDVPCPGHPAKGVPACKATMDWRLIKTADGSDAAPDVSAVHKPMAGEKTKDRNPALQVPESSTVKNQSAEIQHLRRR